MDAVNYYLRAEKVMGGREKMESFYQLLMVPGRRAMGQPTHRRIHFPAHGPRASARTSYRKERADSLTRLTRCALAASFRREEYRREVASSFPADSHCRQGPRF